MIASNIFLLNFFNIKIFFYKVNFSLLINHKIVAEGFNLKETKKEVLNGLV